MNFDINKDQEIMTKKMEEAIEASKTAFKECIKYFFIACPEVKAIVWEQYTPYFNDGDECVFRVCPPVFVIDDFDDQDLKNSYCYNDNGINEYDKDGRFKEEYKQMFNFIRSNDDLMKLLFNDHTTVWVTPNEIITEEYEHE